MSWVSRWAAHCDAAECGHEWLVDREAGEPRRCAKCKSRKWNAGRPDPAFSSESLKKIAPESAVANERKVGGTVATPKMPAAVARPEHAEGCPCNMCKIKRGEM